MTRGFSNASHLGIDGPPAEYRQVEDLFGWARERALAVRELNAKIAEQETRKAEVERVLHDTTEFRDSEAAKERVRDAKKDAADRCAVVAKEREASRAASKALRSVEATRELRKVKKSLKALTEVRDETKGEIVRALADGKKPGIAERVVPDRDAGFRDALARAAGPGGSVTVSTGDKSVRIEGK